MLSPIYPEFACQMSQSYYLGTFNPLRFVVWAARCLLPMYCQSTYFPVWGCYFFFVFHCTVRVPSFLSEDVTFSLYFTATSLLMYLPSHINHCCQVSPNVLSKHHQSVWGSYTCLLLVLDWAQLILHLSRWAAVAGLQVLLPSASNVLSKYLRFVWGSHFLFSLPSVTYCTVKYFLVKSL